MTNGPTSLGSVIAFKVAADARTVKLTLEPARISANFKVSDPVAIANGVVFAFATRGERESARRPGGATRKHAAWSP
jgi:hypothetical protein